MDPETLRQSLLALLTPNAHPLTAIRIDQILALRRIVTLLEDALADHPPLVYDPKRGPRIHPLLDALAKNRERLRRAVNDLERALPKPQRPEKGDKGQTPLAGNNGEAAKPGDSAAPIGKRVDQSATASSPSPPRGRGRGEGQPITGGPAPSTIPVGADLRVRPAAGASAAPIQPSRARLLRLARAQLLPV